MNNSFIVMQGSLATATAVAVTAHTATFSDGSANTYGFDYRKAYSSGKLAFATGVAGSVTVTPATAAASTQYSFTLSQYRPDVGMGWVTRVINCVTPASGTPTATTICNAFRTAVNAYIAAGTFVGTTGGGATFIFTATNALPLIGATIIINITSATVTQGTAPNGTVASLVAQGIPATALTDTAYDIYSYLCPETQADSDGSVDQVWRSVKLLVGNNATNYTAITQAILRVDLGTTTYNSGVADPKFIELSAT